MASSRGCKHDPDSFCYVCGVFLSTKAIKHKITEANNFANAYYAYFDIAVGDQDKNWAPHVVCGCCRSTLEAWYRGENRKIKFGVPRTWCEPTDHHMNCYFCVVDVPHHRKRKKTSVFDYPDIQSSLRPIAHSDELPVPPNPKMNECSSVPSDESTQDEDLYEEEDLKHHFPNQHELNDLIRDLGLTKSNAEILTSRLREWNLLDRSCKISEQRQRDRRFSQYFTLKDKLCYCHNVWGLFEEIGFPYDPKDWRLFIDSSCKSLKAVLLNNGNKYPSIPIAHSKLKRTETKCSGNKGIIYESGIEVDDKLYRIFEICYDPNTDRTYYTHNTLHGATVNYNIVVGSRPKFDADGMKLNTRTVNIFYTQKNQMKIFKKLFGDGQTYINTTSFLARGHLSPDADFMFGYEKYSTYYYINAAPQFQSINAGNWLKVEDMSRSLAAAYGNDIESYNGYFGIGDFTRTSKAKVKVYLDPNQQVFIPKYYFKVLWQKSSDSAIVFVSVNNPFTPNGKAEEFCTNICAKVKLDHENFRNVTKGHIFCCELEDFKKKFQGLPVEVKAKKLLMGTDKTLEKRKPNKLIKMENTTKKIKTKKQ